MGGELVQLKAIWMKWMDGWVYDIYTVLGIIQELPDG
jgi:hypothetical protein